MTRPDLAALRQVKSAHMNALAELVNLDSTNFKGSRRDWLDRDEAMRLVPTLRDKADALATMALALLSELAALRERESGAWRPIESAPKDGEFVTLLVLTNVRPMPLPMTGRWLHGTPGCWVIVNADMAIQRVDPTHWQPLPGCAPPAPSSAPEPGLVEAARKGLEALVALRESALDTMATASGWEASLDTCVDAAEAAIAALRAALGKEEAK